MPRNEKAGIMVLAIAGIFALFFGLWRLSGNIKKPFLKSGGATTVTEESDLLVDLSSKDTDSDGLVDYDELYIYGTSPYIEDSDSDGKPDAEEIAAGTDPNCPEGTNCGSNAAAGVSALDSEAQNADKSNEVVDLNNLMSSDIRRILESAGVDKATLDTLDDAALMDIYYKTLKETQGE